MTDVSRFPQLLVKRVDVVTGGASASYGSDAVVGVVGEIFVGGGGVARRLRSAAGPDLRQLVLGSEGVFGVITSVQIRIRPAPTTRVFEGRLAAGYLEALA